VTLALSPLARKELRALAPIWVAATATLVATGLVGLLPAQRPFATSRALMFGASLELLGLLAFVLGAVSLGAMSVGHEYAHRTLGQLLAQPDHRARLFRTKCTVLALVLVALTSAAAATILREVWLAPLAFLQSWRGALLVLVPLLALSVAPWLTMVGRNPLAAIVFTLAIPAALWVPGDFVGHIIADADPGVFADRVRYGVLWTGVLVVSAVAALASHRTFLGLEVRDDPGLAGVEVPATVRGQKRRREAGGRRVVTGPMTALIRKELRLQSVTFIAATLYVVLWAALLPFASSPAVKSALFAVTMLYVGLVATLAGAIPSAEERALGTLEWQLLQPAAASAQWVVKAATALALSLMLAFALPLLFETVSPWVELLSTLEGPLSVRRAPLQRVLGPASLFALVTCCSLYVSSVCAAGVRALILTWPLVAAMVVFPGILGSLASAAAWDLLGLQAYVDASQRAFDALVAEGVTMGPAMRQIAWVPADAFVWSGRLTAGVGVGLFAGLIIMLLRLGFANHRSAERDRGRIVRQLVSLLLVASLGSVLFGAIQNVVLRAYATMP
jgi:hypothetical protein